MTPNRDQAEPLNDLSLQRLPAERERLLEQAVALVADEYEPGGTLADFEALSEEDLVDASIAGE